MGYSYSFMVFSIKYGNKLLYFRENCYLIIRVFKLLLAKVTKNSLFDIYFIIRY